ncbi:DUF2461 family protein, partial [Acinetobacter baumannii]
RSVVPAKAGRRIAAEAATARQHRAIRPVMSALDPHAAASIRGLIVPPMPTYFTDASFRFLRALARHNERAWFQAHKADYETHVRAPFQ